MPLQATSGAASQDAFGGNGVAVVPAYIEDVFSTTLFTGTDTNPNTITNGIDLSTKGGLVWIKERNAGNHSAWDTARGVKNLLIPNLTNENLNIPVTYPAYPTYGLQSFNTTGFTLGKNWEGENAASSKIVSWTFRKQPKFFDIVTYTGTGVARTVAHNLGSVPGCIIVKRTDTAGFDWIVYHRSTGNTNRLLLNDTVPAASGTSFWNDTTPTSTVFTVGTNVNGNASGGTYVAYLFAHDAGGFGLTGTDNVISCGSFVGTGSDLSVNLGYEPQWLLIKRASSGTDNWRLYDNMRGMFVNYDDNVLFPNLSNAELEGIGNVRPTATGFDAAGSFPASGVTYIYIAIRRGPMKVPTTGTSVYNGVNNNSGLINVGLVPDLALVHTKGQWDRNLAMARLTGANALRPNATNAEEAQTIYWDKTNGYWEQSASGGTPMSWFFRRAPSFMDEICFDEATAPVSALPHNLTVVPELVIYKKRSGTSNWITFSNVDLNKYLRLNTDNALTAGVGWSATSTTVNLSQVTGSATAVAYLFATCAGVSKVGSYTGTATTQVINCGFTAGARWIMIKRTDSTGDWYVWDSARGIVAGNDPYLLLNSTAAEVTGTDYVDTAATGFELSSTAPAAINANGGTYIFLAIA